MQPASICSRTIWQELLKKQIMTIKQMQWFQRPISIEMTTQMATNALALLSIYLNSILN
jgi:hypothetical protein